MALRLVDIATFTNTNMRTPGPGPQARAGKGSGSGEGLGGTSPFPLDPFPLAERAENKSSS